MINLNQIVEILKKDNFVVIKKFFDRKTLAEIKQEIKLLKKRNESKR